MLWPWVTHHFERVRAFMHLANQATPDVPTEPTEEVRLLRAKLIFEEAMETIQNGLGVRVWVDSSGGANTRIDGSASFEIAGPFNMVETIDGCCDISVVTVGTLIACGVPDTPFLTEIDANNLRKFGPGHSIREDGKLIKPPGHTPPDISGVLHKWKVRIGKD